VGDYEAGKTNGTKCGNNETNPELLTDRAKEGTHRQARYSQIKSRNRRESERERESEGRKEVTSDLKLEGERRRTGEDGE
jgi:hypothetical protein